MSATTFRLWWLNPAWLFATVAGGAMLAAMIQDEDAYRLYDTPKYLAAEHVLLAAGIVAAFGLGCWLALALRDGRASAMPPTLPPTVPPTSASRDTERIIRLWFWITFALSLFGYAVWAGVGLRNGVSLDMLAGLMSDATPEAEQMVREELFPTIPGVTTCTQFGLVTVLLGAWLFFRGHRRILWPLAVIMGLALVRAALWRERTAVLMLVLPAAILWLRCRVLARPSTPLGRLAWQFGPLAGVAFLLVFFGTFEYFRSWQHYQHDFDSYAQFVVWRLGGYFTTALNNGAMNLETQASLPLPYWTLRPWWQFPGVTESVWGYHALTGVDPAGAHENMLHRFGNPGLNNEGGLFMPTVDLGVAGSLAFWFACGLAAGELYRRFLVGTVAGLALFPVVVMAILEAPLILYLCLPASFPAYVALLAVVGQVHWRRRHPWSDRPKSIAMERAFR